MTRAAIIPPTLSDALELPEIKALVEAVECERRHKSAYDATPNDRGGANGPKGKAYWLWMDARADVDAALAALTKKE